MHTSCPTSAELEAFALGTLATDLLEQIGDHVELCPACQQQLGELSGEDSLVESLRRPAPIGVPGGVATLAAPQEHREALRLRGYELLGLLGQGGMGAVYLARHASLDRLAAIKLLPAERLGDALAVARFQREIRALAALDHPHIVRATDGGQALGWHFLAMEYVVGVNAGELGARLGPLPVAAACEIVRQAALGIDHACRMGFVHRDIKPSNLMVSTEGLVKVLDFGLAAILEREGAGELTDTGQVMGTLEYMAPEQLADTRAVDHRADLYSLGCTLYKLLAGTGPFSGTRFRHPARTIQGHTHLPHEPLRLRRPDVPPEVAAVVDRLLIKDPGGRFDSGAAVAAALGPWSQGADLAKLVQHAQSIGIKPGEAAHETPKGGGPLPATESLSKGPVLAARIPEKPNVDEKSQSNVAIIAVAVAASLLVLVIVVFSAGYLLIRGAIASIDKTIELESLPPPHETPAPPPPEPERKPAKPASKKPAKRPAGFEPEEPRPAPPAPSGRAPLPLPGPEDAWPAGQPKPDPQKQLLPRPEPKGPEPPAKAAVEAQVALPPEPLLVESELALRQAFRNQLAEVETYEQRMELFGRLVKMAETTRDDPAGRCAVLRVARRVAEDAGSPRAAFEAIAMLDRYFKLDVLKLQTETVRRLKGHEKADPRELSDAMLSVVAGAISREDFDLAGEFAPLALVTARKSQDAAAIRKATVGIGETSRAREEHAQAQLARETLRDKPADPRANHVAGRYAVVFRGEWETGLAMLSRGDDAAWKAAAIRDAAQPKTAVDQVQAADAWWQLGEQASGMARDRLHKRASTWYAQALAGLPAAEQTRVRARLEETPAGQAMLSGALPAVAGSKPLPNPSSQPAVPAQPPPREPPKLPEGAVWLADLQGKAEGLHGADQLKRTVSLAGTEHRNAIWGQPTQDQGTARISFPLGGQYTHLKGMCGMTDETNTFQVGDPMTPGAVFEIYGDNKLLWTSKPLVGRGATQEFDVKLRNVRTLVLVSKSNTYSYLSKCAWGSPTLER